MIATKKTRTKSNTQMNKRALSAAARYRTLVVLSILGAATSFTFSANERCRLTSATSLARVDRASIAALHYLNGIEEIDECISSSAAYKRQESLAAEWYVAHYKSQNKITSAASLTISAAPILRSALSTGQHPAMDDYIECVEKRQPKMTPNFTQDMWEPKQMLDSIESMFKSTVTPQSDFTEPISNPNCRDLNDGTLCEEHAAMISSSASFRAAMAIAMNDPIAVGHATTATRGRHKFLRAFLLRLVGSYMCKVNTVKSCLTKFVSGLRCCLPESGVRNSVWIVSSFVRIWH